MKSYHNSFIVSFSLVFYAILWFLMQPYLGYMLDSDCVSYLTIAERVAHQDYFKSINGLWSPLNCWLLVPFIKAGFNTWSAAKALNFFIGAIIILLSFKLFFQLIKNKFYTLLFAISLPIMLVYFVYFQQFGDVLQIAFILLYLIILISKNFTSSFLKIIFSSLVMALAYYAKAYSLYFFMLHFSFCMIWFYKSGLQSKIRAIKNTLVGIVTIVIFVLPWTYLLHKKYNEWTFTGNAGKLNMSWYINCGKTFKPTINLLIPPVYNDSPSFWEDPYLTQENLSSPLTSPTLFIKWIARVLLTTIESIVCFNEISFLAIAILLVSIYFFFIKKTVKSIQTINIQLIILTIIILPVGYLMMHIETRYIWLNSILLFILAFLLVEKIQTEKIQKIIAILVACSFIYFPLLQYKNLKYKNKDLFEKAALLNQLHFKGKFTSNINDAGQMWVIAYLTNSQFYTIEKTDYTERELVNEMKKYGVNYYFFEAENNVFHQSVDTSHFEKVVNIQDIEVNKFRDEILK